MSSMDPPERPKKRTRPTDDELPVARRSRFLTSLDSPVSPPPSGSRSRSRQVDETPQIQLETPPSSVVATAIISSPFSLTKIRDLLPASNQDTVSLPDLIGGPLVREIYNFNYLHDIDFIREALDDDIRETVKLNIVHGFWKQEDPMRLQLKTQASEHANVKLHTAYMPEIFGTHHTKLLVVLNRDDTAQVVIHTANMISRDWTNMTQAVWRSPLLKKTKQTDTSGEAKEGSGEKFKADLLAYLRYYNKKRQICNDLVKELELYDFSAIRASLIASVPGRHAHDSEEWGWPRLGKVLRSIPTQENKVSDIVLQISSIATLGGTDAWLSKTLFPILRRSSSRSKSATPHYKVIFPTADEIRRCLDGYEAGASIHTKIQSAQQKKQLQYLKPLFHHWAGDGAQHPQPPENVLDAGRKRAAPHIKTYVRYSDSSKKSIDWALVTSANLSKQAWGEALNSAGEVRVASWELGVVVWPELYGPDAKMVPTFKTDTPKDAAGGGGMTVGFRMPYDLPLVPYAKADLPWVATESYEEPDWKGETWTS